MPGHEQDVVFIIGAYVGVAVVTLGLVIAVVLASRRTSRRLAALEADGPRRRTKGPAA